MKKFLLLAGASSVIYSLPARATLTYFEVARWENFTQNSNAQPTVHNSLGFTGRVFTKTASEVQNGTVQTPLATVHNMNPNGAFITAYSHFGFASEAALAAVYPTGTYTFTLTNGPRAGDTDTLVFKDPGWADKVPYLTGSTYSSLQDADVTAPITFSWESFDSSGTFSGLQSYFYLTDLTTGTSVFGSQGDPDNFTSKTFAANSLVPGHNYQFQLVFGVLDQALTQGELAPATWTAAKYIATAGRFTTRVRYVAEQSTNLSMWEPAPGVVIDTMAKRVTIPLNGAERYYRLRAFSADAAAPVLKSVTLEGPTLVVTYATP